MKIEFKEKCTVVYDCYKYNNGYINYVANLIVSERKLRGLPVTRSSKSYANEIRAHKRAYKLGIMRNHTKDCDCEEPISKIKDLIYGIFGR